MRRLLTSILMAGSATVLQADFTYNSTSQMTGGSLLKLMSFMSGKMKEPVQSTSAVMGNRMAHKSGVSSQIIDLDKETITHVNYDKKTYSTMTFAEMKEMVEKAMAKAQGKQKSDINADFKVSRKETGQTKQINGYEAKELLVTIDMTATSTEQPSAAGAMQVNSDMWMVSGVKGYGEMRDFQMRMAQKIDWAPGSMASMGRADMSKGMAELYKAGAQMDGFPMMQVMRMNGSMTGMPAASGGSSSSPSQGASSPSDAIASALGGRFGLGGKKKTPPSDNNGTAPAQANGAPDALIEMTQTVNNFNNSAADPSLFEVPAGFKLVKEDPMAATRGR